ncbi:MAG: V-type ATP synthase subunit F [Spirochaetota bacterium]
MELFCVGDETFCGVFALAGARSAVCHTPDEAADKIISRGEKDDLVIISENLLKTGRSRLSALLRDRSRNIITLPSPDENYPAEQDTAQRSTAGADS